MRVIQSPGVEIREVDLSQNPSFPAGTNIFLAGFTNKGPTDEVLQITSVPELEQIYGEPTSPAERYFYFTARQILQDSPGNLYVNRLPYGSGLGEGFGSKVGALVYPVVSLTGTPTLTGDYTVSSSLDITDGAYLLGKPKFFELTQLEYLQVLDGSAFTWSVTSSQTINSISDFGKAGVIVLNPSYTTTNARGEGYYLAVTDNTNAEPTTNHDSVRLAYTVSEDASTGLSDYTLIPSDRLYFALTGSNDAGTDRNDGNISLNIEKTFYSYADATTKKFDDIVALNLYKLRRSPYTPEVTKLEYTLQESYLGSLDFYRKMQDQRGGPAVSYFLGGQTTNSQNVRVLVNDNISNRIKDTWLDEQGQPRKKVRVLSVSTQTALQAAANDAATAQAIYSNAALLSATTFSTVCAAELSGGSSEAQAISAATLSATAIYNTTIIPALTLQQTVTATWVKFGFNYAAFNAASLTFNYVGDFGADALFPVGPYVDLTYTTKTIGSLTQKISRSLYKIENDEIFPLDIVVEGGLGTIYSTCCASGTPYYDDTVTNEGLTNALAKLTTSNDYSEGDDASLDIRGNYHAVYSLFETFCSQQRKDCLFIADPIRHIFVKGENTRVLADPSKPFSQYIYSALRHNFELANSSHACTYANWVQVNDPYAGINVWVPFSGFAAADMASTDANFQPWYAPAGFTRGRVRNALSMAITPKQKERDQLYKIGLNPVAFFPNDGFTIFGQKTLQRQPSAFDRINVRRLFLYLEKATKQTVKYFVFEPNTLFTRNRVIQTLQPIFELAKNTEGLYDYLLVCDKRNNTESVIDNNELVIDVYLKPVRTAEFILVNFIATRTSANFSELVAGPRL